jgi:hypothetical protein
MYKYHVSCLSIYFELAWVNFQLKIELVEISTHVPCVLI